MKTEIAPEQTKEGDVPILFARNPLMCSVVGTKSEITDIDGLQFGVLALDPSRTIDPSEEESVLLYNERLSVAGDACGFVDASGAAKTICYPACSSNYVFYAYRVSDAPDSYSGTFSDESFIVNVELGRNDILWAKSTAPLLEDPSGSGLSYTGFNRDYAIASRLWYSGDALNAYCPSFNFNHLTAELKFSFVAESAEAAESLGSSIRLARLRLEGLPSSGVLDVVEGTITADPPEASIIVTPSSIYPTVEGTDIGEGIFTVPGIESFSFGYSIVFNGRIYHLKDDITVNAPEGGFKQGHSYEYKIVVKSKDEIIALLSSPDSPYVEAPEPEAVDLGLSVKWASCNLGAISPEGYGDYYAWGETEPKDNYSWSTYKFGNSSSGPFSKYNTQESYGTVDNKTVLDLEDDAAHVALGSSWRMPTDAEWTELRKNCISTWTDNYNGTGVSGRIVTSKVSGYKDKSIFLPAAGYCSGTFLYHVGSWGRYWSSSLSTDHADVAWRIGFVSAHLPRSSGDRRYGYPVRPVYGTLVPVTGITLSQSSASVEVGDSFVLTASITPANAAEKGVNWSSSDASIAAVDSNGQVTTVAVGTAIITATTVDGGFTATCEVTVTPAMAVPEAVDLGLSVKWASFNLGASKPEEYGDYYAWGETEPYYSSQNPLIWKDGKSAGYDWLSYKWCNGSEDSLTKYNANSKFGLVDNKTVLDPEDDAAQALLGSSWRMPTDAEWTELRENCTWTWTSDYNGTGVAGRIVTSNKAGYTDKRIFLPAAGRRFDAVFYFAGSFGYYWSSSLVADPRAAWSATLYPGDVGRGSACRVEGYSVRPITD